MIRDTSLLAFMEVRKELGKKQKEVYKVISLNPQGLCNREIAKILGWEINSITPRVFELREMGYLIDAGTKECPYTGRKVHYWKVR